MNLNRPQKLPYRPDIDGLRAIAVLAVLFFHLDRTWCTGGFIGVDMFLVISGFLITNGIKREIESTGTFSFRNFYSRRIRRLVPAMAATLIFSSIGAALLFSPAELVQFARTVVASIFSLSNVLFWNEADYFDATASTKPLLHTWSLSVEEQFYIFWPLVIVALTRKRTIAPLVSISAIATLSLLANFLFQGGVDLSIPRFGGFNDFSFEDGSATIFFLLPFRIFEFAIGAPLCWLPSFTRQKRDWGSVDLVIVASLVTLVAGFTLFDEHQIFPTYNGLFPCIATALLIYFVPGSPLAVLLENRGAVYIGKISYSLYLVHWPLIVFWKQTPLGKIDHLAFLILMVTSIGLAHVLNRLVEQKFRTPGTTSNPQSKVFFPALGLTLLALCISSISMMSSNGWIWRLPNEYQRYAYAGNFAKEQYGGHGYSIGRIVPEGLESQEPADIVLLGDSHGAHYAEGIFHEWASPQNLTFFNAAGTSCFYLPGLTRLTEGFDWDGKCTKARMIAKGYIKGNKTRAPTIVISHSWLNQIHRGGLLPDRTPMTLEDLKASLLRFASEFNKSRIIVIGQVPSTGGRYISDLLSKPAMYHKLSPSDVRTTPLSDSKIEFNKTMEDLAKSTGLFEFWNPEDILCSADRICKNLEGGEIIYSDSSHLSKFGSRLLIREFLQR